MTEERAGSGLVEVTVDSLVHYCRVNIWRNQFKVGGGNRGTG